MYADYLREYEGKSVFETEDGFASYECAGDSCYIDVIYVKPEKRQTGEASKIADSIVELVKPQGITKLIGSVDLQGKTPTTSMKVLLGYGMKVVRTDGMMIYFVKDI